MMFGINSDCLLEMASMGISAFVVTCTTGKSFLGQIFRILEMLEHYTLKYLSSVTFYRSISGPVFFGTFLTLIDVLKLP
jgi:hypothetical protein